MCGTGTPPYCVTGLRPGSRRMTDVSPGGRRRAPSPSRPEVDPFAAQPFSSHRRIVASSHRRARCRWRGRVDRRGLHGGRPDTGVEGGSVQPLALAMILRKVTQWPQLEALLAFVREVIEGDTATSMMGRACATSTMFARSFCFRLFHLRSRSGQLGTWGDLLQRSPHRADIQSALGVRAVQRVEQRPVGHRERPGTG